MQAVFSGDAATVQRLVGSPTVDLNAPQPSGGQFTPIEVAAMRSQPAVIRMLLAHGARVQGSPRPVSVALNNLSSLVDPEVPKIWAPERTPGDYELSITLLLDAGADPDASSDPTHPGTGLRQLVLMRHFDGDARIASALVTHGAHLGDDAPGGSPLAFAIERHRDDLVTVMLAAQPPQRGALDAGLAAAFAAGNPALAQRLIASGADPNARAYGRPVLCAAMGGSDPAHALARALLERGANPNVDCLGNAPITLAPGDRDTILAFLAHGADPNRPDRYGATVLGQVTDDDPALADAILARGGRLGVSLDERRQLTEIQAAAAGGVVRAILHRQDYVAGRLLALDGLGADSTCTAVLYASAAGTTGTLAELLRRGGDPNSMNERGSTALMVAASRGHNAALGVLLAQRSTKVDATTPRIFHPPSIGYSEESPPLWTGNRTALMYAALNGHADSVRLLLAHGAAARREDAEGHDASWYARTPEVREALGGAR